MPRRATVASCLLLLAASTEALQASRPVLRTARAVPPTAVTMGLKPADASANKPSGRPFPVASLALGTLLAFAPSAAHAVEPALGSTGLLAAGAQAVGGVVSGGDFVPSFSLIFLSEIGDKTFFIAALLAARTSKLLTFAGCAGALALMTVISVAIGQIFHAVPSSFTRGLPIDDYVAIASFLYFGVKSLLDAREIGDDNAGIAEEREDAEETLKDSGSELKGGWPLVVEAFTLTTVAEIGDRSQLATIALSAAGNPLSVCAGATAGHFIATGTAVLAGSYLSQYLSEKGILILGGVLFILFAFTTAFGIF